MTDERRVSTRTSKQTYYDPPMTFGKYKGSKVSSLPDDYLAWLVSDADVRSPELREAVEAEWKRRRPKKVDMTERPRPLAGTPQWWVFEARRDATAVYGPWDNEQEAKDEAKRLGRWSKGHGSVA